MSAQFFSNPPLPQNFQNFIIPSNSNKQYSEHTQSRGMINLIFGIFWLVINSLVENSISEQMPPTQPLIIDEDIEYTPVEITIPEEPRNTDEELQAGNSDLPLETSSKQDSFSLDYSPGQEE